MSQAEQLGEDFPSAVLETQRKGSATFTYVPYAEVVARMNRVLGAGSWGVADADAFVSPEHPDWVIGRARVWAEVDGHRGERMGYGGQQINRYSSGSHQGDPVDLGNDYKGAVSDAVKKACQGFGVGLYLAREEAAIRTDAPESPVPAPESPVPEGWTSWDEHNEFKRDTMARAKRLPQEAQDRLRESWGRLGLSWPMTAAQADTWEALVEEWEKSL